jgi:demethylmenaquinone methyltransferase / 2-methoxy-6-polyprenyl-1,4-benzoquinol methylase
VSGGKKEAALELFGGLAPEYEKALDLATVLQDRYWKKWVAEKAELRGSDRVLDVGCGTLVLEERLLPAGCGVVGLDLTDRMLRVGQRKRLANVMALVNGDAESLPFADETFDAVVSCYVAKYVALGRLVAELARVVRPGGRVVLYDFVSPRGAFRLPLALYVRAVIGTAGSVLRAIESEASTTFLRLPGIVEGATWDRRLLSLTRAHGMETLAFARLTGGAVCAYAGAKPGRAGAAGLRYPGRDGRAGKA